VAWRENREVDTTGGTREMSLGFANTSVNGR
jgi:hypothetical protein